MLSVICIENSYNGLIYKNGDKFISTKNIQGVHGTGIKSVHTIIDKYNGHMQQDYTDSIFKTVVIIPADR